MTQTFRCVRGSAIAGMIATDEVITAVAPILKVKPGTNMNQAINRLVAEGWIVEEQQS